MSLSKPGEGWSWVMAINGGRSRKWHYFVVSDRGILSLCGNQMLFSSACLEEGNDDSPDNCKACVKKLAKRKLAEVM